jgi:hypothetical protein
VEIQYRSVACADAGALMEQFADNIGMVRRVVSTIAGPRTFDLVQARVGGSLMSAGSTGGFILSAMESPEPGAWQATLRVSLPHGTSLNLRFPSGQMYEVKLRNSEGRILWTWSADKLFLQADHYVRVTGEWSATVMVPHPPATPEGPHVYTLEAWLTTAEGEPRFGAVTTVEMPRTVPGVNAGR